MKKSGKLTIRNLVTALSTVAAITTLSFVSSVVSRVEEPRKIGEKIWRRIALYPTQQKRASYGPLFIQNGLL